MKYKLGATIPTVQYGNIMPEIELEGDSLEALHEQAMAHIEGVWKRHGSSPLTVNRATGQIVDTFTGEQVRYDPVSHTYTDMQGNVLLSGSVYAEKQGKKFDPAMMVPRTAKSWGVDEADLGKLWELNGRVSNEYGSALHTALEIYHRYWKMGAMIQIAKKLDYNYCLPKNIHLRDAVIGFVEKFGVDALPEVFVSDVANGRVGQIDRLAILDAEKKVCRIGDYKSNNDMTDEKLAKYQHQLSFYGQILMAKGWKVMGLDIYHFTDKGWEKMELPVLDLVV